MQELKEMTQAQLAADMEAGFTEESSDLSVHSSGTHGSLFWGDQHHSTASMEQLSPSSLDDGISVLDSCCSSSNPPFDESPTKCSSKRQQHCPRWTNKSGRLQTMMINVSPSKVLSSFYLSMAMKYMTMRNRVTSSLTVRWWALDPSV